MRKITAFFLGLICTATMAIADETIPSQIKEVTLLFNKALVKREASGKVGKGLQRLLIDVQAYAVDKESVQAKVWGEGDIFSVQLKEMYLVDAPQENVKAIQKKIQDAEFEKKALLNDIEVLNKKEMFLDSLIDFSKVELSKEIATKYPNADDLKKTLAFLDEGYTGTKKKRNEINQAVEEWSKKIDVLKKELSSLKRSPDNAKKVVEVLFNSKKDQALKIEARYLADRAAWEPFYKVDTAADLKDVTMSMFSKIRQKTGEDWDGVKLTISTASPIQAGSIPVLNSWILDVMPSPRALANYAEGVAGSAMLSRKMKVDGDAMMTPAMEMAVPQEAQMIQAQAVALPLSFEYELGQAINVASRDEETIIPLFSKTLSGTFSYYAVPKISPFTLLLCKAASQQELLSASLNIYMDGRYVGKTRLDEKRAGEEFEINLGIDRDVKIKREKIKDKVKETFFSGKLQRKTLIREITYKTTAENTKSIPISLKIEDALPISRTDRIAVKDVKIFPEPSEKDHQSKEGVMLWKLELKPKEKKEITIDFTLTYPVDIPDPLL